MGHGLLREAFQGEGEGPEKERDGPRKLCEHWSTECSENKCKYKLTVAYFSPDVFLKAKLPSLLQ